MTRSCVAIFILALFCAAAPAHAASSCADGVQKSGSIYRICMPPAGEYNGILVIWAHGFQDAGTPVQIPEDQLCLGDFCIPDIINGLGFAFATNSYSKTGLAVLQGKNDILDLVKIFAKLKGHPQKVYLVGASEGGLITALALEQHPDIFSAGLAACGPVGDFPFQISYFGNARATFDYFFPGVIPGDPFHPDPELVAQWSDYYEKVVEPAVFAPVNRPRLDEWVKVAGLPFDADDYLNTVAVSVEDALRYGVVNLTDASETLGGFPFDNRQRWYFGSTNDLLLNVLVPRIAAAPAALTEMNTKYQTTGALVRPLVTLHTLRDQQVPYLHELIYDLKTFVSGSWLTRHLNIPIDRFEHCNFTRDEALFSFAVMLFYDATLEEVSGVSSFLDGPELAAFETRARAAGLPYKRAGKKLVIKLKR